MAEITERCTPHPEPDYRFTLANERTFLAWQRTSLGILAASLAAVHILAREDAAFGYALGGGLGALAIATALGGLLRWRKVDTAIRSGSPLPVSHLLTLLAMTLAVLGFTALLATLLLSLPSWI